MPSEIAAGRHVELGCDRIHLALFERVRPEWDEPPFDEPQTTARRYLEMLEDSGTGFGRILDLASECDSLPILVHCHAGRDRTGIVIACVLELLGVPDELIAADYALSDGLIDGRRAYADTMQEFLRLSRVRYGSVREMALRLGARESTLSRLIEALSAPPSLP